MKFKYFFSFILIIKFNLFNGPTISKTITTGLDDTQASKKFVNAVIVGEDFLTKNELLIQFALFGVGAAGTVYAIKEAFTLYKIITHREH